MAYLDWLAKDDEGRAVQMITTRDNLPAYLTDLGIAPTDPLYLQFVADATYYRALINLQKTFQQFGLALTNWKNYERDGGAVAVPQPHLPVLPPDFPTTVPPGIITRYRFFVNYLKGLPGYIRTIGLALGIEGGHSTAPDLNTVQPAITATIAANRIEIGWGWGGNGQYVDAIEIHVDRGDGKGFVFLVHDTTPGYIDTMPFPATLTKWTYRAIYRVGENQVGLWSAPVSVNVGG